MVDHTIPLTLPEHFEATATAPGPGRTLPGAMTTAGDDEQVDDATLLPAWVLERLHAIMETLEYASDLQGLMSAFVEIRSTETFVSLQARLSFSHSLHILVQQGEVSLIFGKHQSHFNTFQTNLQDSTLSNSQKWTFLFCSSYMRLERERKPNGVTEEYRFLSVRYIVQCGEN